MYNYLDSDDKQSFLCTFIPVSIGDKSAKGTSRVASSHNRTA